ncbi:MAG: MarR family transcriptional regulator [Tardiphaga sp.]
MPDPGLTDALALTLAAEIRDTYSHFKRRFRDKAAVGDLTVSQIAALSRLDREGAATVTALARAEGVRPQSMGATIAALEAIGLVGGTPDPDDGRQTIWALTPACREMVRIGRAAREDWLFHAIQTQLTGAEQQQLADAIGLLKRVITS